MWTRQRIRRSGIFISQVFLILIFFIESCSYDNNHTTPMRYLLIKTWTVEANLLTRTSTPQKKQISLTPSPVNTSTATLTITPSPSPTIEWTPLPTLPKNQADGMVKELLKNNGGCVLPCWFGITPGISKWQEVKQKFNPFSNIQIITGKGDYSMAFRIPGEESDWGAYLVEEKGIISFIMVDPIVAKRGGWVLSTILEKSGKPDQIYLSATKQIPGKPGFLLVLDYRRLNFLAFFELDGWTSGDEICTYLSTASPRLFLWSDQGMFEPPEGEYPDWLVEKEGRPPLTLAQNETKYDIQSFYETFKSPKFSGRLCTRTDDAP